ncbi:MAG TPA: class IV adenylate cyclase [Isosphaeraceae bacterium]|jgi:predicted adenylyl cyclase CyaB
MPTNIEIKARAPDLRRLQTAVEAVSETRAEIRDQEDVFFKVPTGRLKLRILGDRHGELISYQREDAAGPKPSCYLIAPTSDPAALKAILSEVSGVLGVVRKRRRVYRIGQTRIHLDEVEGLGQFVEVEVVLRPEQTEDEGVRIARHLMDRLGIAGDQLVAGAYIDLLAGGP